MATLYPYPVYKESGVEWLGKVPEHWEVSKLKRSLANIMEQKTHHSEPVIALENVESWTGRVVIIGINESSFSSKLKRFQSGDILFGKLRPYLAKVVQPASDGLCVGEFLVLRTRHEDATATFFEFLLRSRPVIDVVTASTFGAKMPRTDWRLVGVIPVACPSLPEQIAIARFLGDANQRIDHCVSAKKKLIKLLEEYRLTLISNVVMGRIDIRTEKNHEKKRDLGSCHQIPRHWQRKRLKYLSSQSIRNGLGKAGKFANPEHPRYIRTTDIAGPRQLRPDTFRSLPPEVAREAQVYENDILISSAGSVGKSFYAKKLDGKACFAGYLVRISPVPEIDPSFIAYWTESDDYWTQINANVIQTTIQNFSATKVRNLSAPIPPLDTQRHIVRFLDDADWRISTRQKLLKREIALLQEHRTRLISDVVTGKLDVREAAVSLPDVDSCTAEVMRTEVPEPVTKV